MFLLPPSWPAGLAHRSSRKTAFGKVRFVTARWAWWHLERREATTGHSQQQLPLKKLPLKNAALAALQCFAELHTQAAVCKTTPTFWKRGKFQTSYTSLTISQVQSLDHAGVSNSCFLLVYYKFTEALQTGNKICCSVQNDSEGYVLFSKQSLNGFHLCSNKNNLHWLWQGVRI